MHPARLDVSWLHSGPWCLRIDRRFSQNQALSFRIVVEDLGVTSPIHRRIKLALDFVRTEMLVKYVVEEFSGNRMICLGLQYTFDLLQDYHGFQHRLAEKRFARLNVSIGEGDTLRSDRNFAFMQGNETENNARFDDGQQILDIHYEFFRKFGEIFPPPTVVE